MARYVRIQRKIWTWVYNAINSRFVAVMVRLACTGILYMCLGQNDNADSKLF